MKTYIFYLFNGEKFISWSRRNIKVSEKLPSIGAARRRERILKNYYGCDNCKVFVGSKISYC